MTGLCMCVGFILLAAGLLRLGFLTSLMSEPAVGGFTVASAYLISSGQVNPRRSHRRCWLPTCSTPHALLGVCRVLADEGRAWHLHPGRGAFRLAPRARFFVLSPLPPCCHVACTIHPLCRLSSRHGTISSATWGMRTASPSAYVRRARCRGQSGPA
jgi:hypothetical protein